MAKNIAIVGSAWSSRDIAPFSDPNWEIWSCSPSNIDLPRTDVFFEMHDLGKLLRDPGYTFYLSWMKKMPKVYLLEAFDLLPNSVSYPFAEMQKLFGPFFWDSTVAYMQALAISRENWDSEAGKPEAIALYGIDMTANDEYGNQRKATQYYIQCAWHSGIKMVVPAESDILEPAPPYGYKERWRTFVKIQKKREELEHRHHQLMVDQKQNLLVEAEIKGATHILEWMEQTGMLRQG